MDSLKEKLLEWLREFLVSDIMNNLNNTFNNLNAEVKDVAGWLATPPADFEPGVLSMIWTISENAVMPIAGIILTLIACYGLIQFVTAHNNPANFETWIFFKWVFKTFVAVELISNTFNITLVVFDMAGYVIQQSRSLIMGSTAIDVSTVASMQSKLESMDVSVLFGIFLQNFVVQFLFNILSPIIFVIMYGRMIEIYPIVSLASIPLATFGNREQSMIGQNYLRSLLTLGFQGFLAMICVAIYAVLIQNVAISEGIMGSLWNVLGYTMLLGFTLLRTGSPAKSVLHAHQGKRQNKLVSYIVAPRDLTEVKSKVAFNLTKRQLICFSLAAFIGVPFFFLFKKTGSTGVAAMGMMVVMMSLFSVVMYERNEEPLEVILSHFIQASFIRPKTRIYQIDNYYAALMRQAAAEKEVEKIVGSYHKPVPEEGKEKLPDSGVSEQQR